MKRTITKQIQFAGKVVRSHATEGSIQTRFAVTSLAGNEFINFKREHCDVYAKYVNWDIEGYDSLIAIFNPDDSTDILINEIQFIDYKNHKAVNGARKTKLTLMGLEIPEEAGILIYLPWGNHQISMYDVTPVLMKSEERRTGLTRDKRRPEDYELVLGALVDEIDCQTMNEISDDDWKEIFDSGWFPFAFLQGNIWCKLREKIHRHEDLTDIIQDISEIIASTWADRIDLWRLHPILKNELDFLESAHKCFVAENWIAVNSILGPRIEGVITEAIGRFLKHRKMIAEFGKTVGQHDSNNMIINPEKLMEYFQKVVYPDGNMMNPNGNNTGMNRHLLGHGRVVAEDLDQLSAVMRFLIIDHVSRYHPNEN